MFSFSKALKQLALVAALVVATVVAAPRVRADPSFGVNPGGPSGLPGAGILEPAPGAPTVGPLALPALAIAPPALGLPAVVTIDDISYGDDMFPTPGPWHLVFSVGAGSVGHPGSPPIAPLPNVTMEGPATPPGDGHVEGDIYSSFALIGAGGPLGAFAPAPGPPPVPPCAIQTNIQSADGNGLPPLFGIPNVGLGLIEPGPFPPPFGDDLDKIDLTDPTVIAPGGAPLSPVFFTIDAASVGFMPIVPPNFSPPSAATVYAFVPGFGIADWAPFFTLGLGPADDIDALMVSYTSGVPIMVPPGWIGAPDVILFSLAPGSPANPGLGSFCFGPGSGLPDDVYFDFAPFGPPPAPAIDAEMLGLNTLRSGGTGNDNLDAMDLCLMSGLDTDGDMIDNNCDFDRDGDLTGNAIDNCPDVANPGQANNDIVGGFWGGSGMAWIIDGIPPEAVTTGGDACDANDDNNGCSDVTEGGASHVTGGQRDALNPWDFADMWVPALPAAGARNGAVSIADAVAVTAWIGAFNGGPPNVNGDDYDSDINGNGVEDGAEYDRSPSTTPGQPWRLNAPNGAVSIADALGVVNSIGDHC